MFVACHFLDKAETRFGYVIKLVKNIQVFEFKLGEGLTF